jgi:hypothetical protein
MGDMVPVFILGVIFYFVIELVRTVADSKLRAQLIEKGMVDDNVKKLFAARSAGDAQSSLKWGIVAVGVGAAFLIGMTPWVRPEFRDSVTAGSIFLLAGLGLIIYHFIARGSKPE